MIVPHQENLKNRLRVYKDFVGELKVSYKRTKLPSVKVGSASDAVNFIKPYFEESIDLMESVKLMHLGRDNRIVNISHLSTGSETAAIVPIKTILRELLLIKSNSCLLFHNHPSGNINPSQDDIKITNKLADACELIEVPLLDHIILTRESFYSFSNKGLL